MFGEITLLMVLQGTALVAAGAAVGYFLALNNFDKQRDKLNDELESARTEIKEHREKVDSHFLKTALLFNRLTDNYREIHEHLATGAQTLCSPQTSTPQLDQLETRVLPAIEGSATEKESESELAATHTPHPDAEAAAPMEAEDSEKPVTETAAEAPAPEEAAEQKVEAKMPKPDAAEVPVADKSTADDAHIGADATPAPTGAGEEKAAAATGAGEKKSTPEVPSTSETSAEVDRYKSPPSIH